jgi:hypothetical protein
MDSDSKCLTFRFKKTDVDLKEWVKRSLPGYDDNFSLLVRQALREKMNREKISTTQPGISEVRASIKEEQPTKDKIEHIHHEEVTTISNDDLKGKLAKLGRQF